MNIDKEIRERRALLLIIPKYKYSSELTKLMKILDKNFNKIGYINLNSSYKTLIKNLTNNKVNFRKFHVIGLNKPSKGQGEIENYRCIGSADNLGGINIEFSDFVYVGCKIFLFDSLSDMFNKVNKSEVVKFVHTMIVKAKIANTKIIFLALHQNIDFKMFKELNMLFDNIISDTSK